MEIKMPFCARNEAIFSADRQIVLLACAPHSSELDEKQLESFVVDCLNQHSALLAVRDAARRLSHNINNPEESNYTVDFMVNASVLVDALGAYDAVAKGEGNAGGKGEAK